MSELYNKIEMLCKENNTDVTKMCREINIPRSSLSELKAGRVKSISIERIEAIADYFGVNTGTIDRDGLRTSLLPFRAFALIYNEWYRDENLQEPVLISTGVANEKGDETLNNNTVTIRDRDTMEQITMDLNDLKTYIHERVDM